MTNADSLQRDKITVTKAGLGDAYESKIKMFFDERVDFLLWMRCC